MLLKVATGIDDNGNVSWSTLYANAIRARLKRDMNLSDVPDKKLGRDNLGVTTAILEAEREAIEISKNDTYKHLEVLKQSIIPRVNQVEEDIFQLSENIGTWGYVSWDNKAVSKAFVDYVQDQLELVNNDLIEFKDSFAGELERLLEIYSSTIEGTMGNHYDGIVRILTQWWENFQSELNRRIEELRSDCTASDSVLDNKISDLNSCCTRIEENLDTMREDIFTVNQRVSQLRDITEQSFIDFTGYMRDSIDLAVHYLEESIDMRALKVESELKEHVAEVSETLVSYINSEISRVLSTLRSEITLAKTQAIDSSTSFTQDKIDNYMKYISTGETPRGAVIFGNSASATSNCKRFGFQWISTVNMNGIHKDSNGNPQTDWTVAPTNIVRPTEHSSAFVKWLIPFETYTSYSADVHNLVSSADPAGSNYPVDIPASRESKALFTWGNRTAQELEIFGRSVDDEAELSSEVLLSCVAWGFFNPADLE